MPELSPTTAAPQQPQQQPPLGASPASQATPNRGYEAAAAQRLGVLAKPLMEILQLSGVASDIGKTVLKMLDMIAKISPPGSVTPAAEKNNIEQMAMRNAQQQGMMKQMQGAQGGGAPKPPGMPGAQMGAA